MKEIIIKSVIIVTILSSLVTSSVLLAEVPLSINYQGRLLDANGIPFNGNVRVDVAIYTNAESGDSVYSEAVSADVPVQNGMYSFAFGAGSTALIDALSNAEAWLSVSVDGEPLLPRQRLISVPFAVSAHTLDGRHGSDYVAKQDWANGGGSSNTNKVDYALYADDACFAQTAISASYASLADQWGSSPNLFAPATIGSSGQVLASDGDHHAYWSSDAPTTGKTITREIIDQAGKTNTFQFVNGLLKSLKVNSVEQ